MPVRSVGFSCKLNMVVCPVPKIEGIGDPCVNPKMLPRASYKCHTTRTLLIEFAPYSEIILLRPSYQNYLL
jgi:hypothetical protein